MSRQALVGMFSLAAIILVIVIAYFLTNLGARTGYPLAVHFQSAAGLQNNAAVYLSGIQVGSVDSIKLLPDDTVDVILSIKQGVGIPTTSRFLMQAPVTGSPTVLIVPPHGGPLPYPTFPPGVAPIDKQPRGSNPATIADLLQQGQGEIRRLDTILAELEKREPQLLATAQSTLSNANEMTGTLKTAVAQISEMLRSDLGTAGANIAAMAKTMNSTMTLNAPRLSHLVAQLDQTSVELNRSMAAIEGLATDPQLKNNLLTTTANVAETTEELKYVLADVRSITSDPQTQSRIRDAVANLDAVLERAASIMGKLGGRSHVPGVDSGVPSSAPSPSASATPHALSGSERLSLGSALGSIARELIEIQVRVGELDKQQVCCPEPLYSADRGPQTDVNAIFLPHSSTSVILGANDIGQYTTWNLAALESVAPYARVGGGVLYSRLGVIGQLGENGTGLDARFYDPRHPMLDVYGNVRIAPWANLFFGERAINQPWRRTDYGIEFHY